MILWNISGSGWKEALLAHIDADQLPVYYGGTATVDGDPKCSEKVTGMMNCYLRLILLVRLFVNNNVSDIRI